MDDLDDLAVGAGAASALPNEDTTKNTEGKTAEDKPTTAKRRYSHSKKKNKADNLQLFAFCQVAEARTDTGRSKRRIKKVQKFDSHTYDSKSNCTTGHGFNCPECGLVCSYASKACTFCGLSCSYEAGVGVVVSEERRDVTRSKSGLKRRRSNQRIGSSYAKGVEKIEPKQVKRRKKSKIPNMAEKAPEGEAQDEDVKQTNTQEKAYNAAHYMAINTKKKKIPTKAENSAPAVGMHQNNEGNGAKIWHDNLEKVIDYREENNKLPLKSSSGLGKWFHNQKNIIMKLKTKGQTNNRYRKFEEHGLLPMEDQAARNQRTWDDKLQEVVDYREEHGKLPTRKTPYGEWFYKHRSLLKALKEKGQTNDRVRKFEEHGLLPMEDKAARNQRIWDDKLQEVIDYREEHDKLPTKGTSYGGWLTTNRSLLKALKEKGQTNDRVRKFEDNGLLAPFKKIPMESENNAVAAFEMMQYNNEDGTKIKKKKIIPKEAENNAEAVVTAAGGNMSRPMVTEGGGKTLKAVTTAAGGKTLRSMATEGGKTLTPPLTSRGKKFRPISFWKTPKPMSYQKVSFAGRDDSITNETHDETEDEEDDEGAKDDIMSVMRGRTSPSAKKQSQIIDLVVDRDNDESISDTCRTYSKSGFHISNKTHFINEHPTENVPPLKYRIEPNEPWRYAWETMRNSGWTWTIGSGLMTDYYYIKPGCKVKGGIKGRDYFITEEGAKNFALRNYGWRGEGAALGLGGNSPGKSPNKRRRKSTEKAETENKRSKFDSLPISKTSKHKASALKAQKAIKAKAPKQAAAKAPVPSNTYDKMALWQALQKNGWRAVKAGRNNKLHDWYYARPGCNPGDGKSKLGVDYFLSEDGAIKSANHSSGSDEAAKENPTDKFESGRKSTKIINNNGLLTPDDCQTKPQDPAIPLLPSPQVSCKSATPDEDYYQWNNIWPLLERAGWKNIKAGRYNPLHDWYYVRPSRHPGDGSSKLGHHFFTCKQDVIAFVKRLDEESSRNGGRKKTKSRDSLGMIQELFEEEARSAVSAAIV